jgi:hypothetical protein
VEKVLERREGAGEKTRCWREEKGGKRGKVSREVK